MISITTEAQDKLTSIIGTQDGTEPAVRVSVVRGPHGCVHGWNLGIEENQQADDAVFAFGSLRILVEPGLADMLDGVEIDYQEEGSAIGFTVNAPSSQGHGDHGGCGDH